MKGRISRASFSKTLHYRSADDCCPSNPSHSVTSSDSTYLRVWRLVDLDFMRGANLADTLSQIAAFSKTSNHEDCFHFAFGSVRCCDLLLHQLEDLLDHRFEDVDQVGSFEAVPCAGDVMPWTFEDARN